MYSGGYSCRAIHFRCKMTCVADEWCPGGQARPPRPPSDCAEEGKASRTIVETSSSSFLPSTSTSLHLFKRSLASRRPFRRRSPFVASEIFGSVGGGEEEVRGGLCVLGRGGVGAWLGVGGAERAFRRSRHPVAAAPTLAKLGLPSPGPAASHSAHQSRRMAGRAKPASESRIGSGGS